MPAHPITVAIPTFNGADHLAERSSGDHTDAGAERTTGDGTFLSGGHWPVATGNHQSGGENERDVSNDHGISLEKSKLLWACR